MLSRRIGTGGRASACILVLALVLGLAAATGAAGPAGGFSDLGGAECQEAVEILSALGLVTGFPDGTFRPAATITRAEFASIAVRALGFGDITAQLRGPTGFSDVPAAHWASGCVNVAATRGLMTGYPNGTFRPEDPVTCSEAVAVIVRLLGYGPAVTGPWPIGYLVKGYELGIPEGVSFTGQASATRGEIARFLENSLTVRLMEEAGAGPYAGHTVGESTLLQRLGVRVASGRVTGVAGLFGGDLGPGQVEIEGTVCDVGEFSDLSDRLGFEVEVKCLPDGRIFQVRVLTSDEAVVKGEVSAFSSPVTDTSAGSVTIGGRSYPLAADFRLYFNNAARADQAAVEAELIGSEAVAVLGSGRRVAGLMATKFEGSLVLTGVDPERNRYEGRNASNGLVRECLDNYTGGLVLRGGKPVSLKEVSPGEVARFFTTTAGQGTYLYLDVLSRRVSGELETVEASADRKLSLTVGGLKYPLAPQATVSYLDGTVSLGRDETSFQPFIGEVVTLHLDASGKVCHVTGRSEAPPPPRADNLGVVKTEFYFAGPADPTEPSRYLVKLFKLDGTTLSLELTDETRLDGEVYDLADYIDNSGETGFRDTFDEAYPVGSIVRYRLDRDGRALSLDLVDPDHASVTLYQSDIDPDRAVVWGRRVTETTLFIDFYLWEVYDWSVFRAARLSDGCISRTALYDGGDVTLEYLVYHSGTRGVSFAPEGDELGVIIGRQLSADGVTLRILGVGEDAGPVVTDRLITSDTTVEGRSRSNRGAPGWNNPEDLDVGDLVTLTLTGAGLVGVSEPAALDPAGNGSYQAEILVFRPDILILDLAASSGSGVSQCILDPACLVWDVVGEPAPADLFDLRAGQIVQVFDLDSDGIVDAVKVTGRAETED